MRRGGAKIVIYAEADWVGVVSNGQKWTNVIYAQPLAETAKKFSSLFQLPTPANLLPDKLTTSAAISDLDLEPDTSYVYTLNHVQSYLTHHMLHIYYIKLKVYCYSPT